jgi:hypothetical protein
MKNCILAFTLLFVAAPAFAEAPTLHGMIEAVKYEAQQCDRSGMNSAYLEEQDTDMPHEQIEKQHGETQTSCDNNLASRLAALNRNAVEEPKPQGAWSRLLHGAPPAETAEHAIREERFLCVSGVITRSIDARWAGDNELEAKEGAKIADCESAAAERLKVL